MELQGKVSRGWQAWAALIRLPNLLTVAGDVLVGYAAVMPFHKGDAADLLLAIFSTVCLYASGLVMNDLMDFDVDRRERPSRPLASRAISRISARNTAGGLFTVSLFMQGSQGSAPLAAGIILGGLIFLYNVYARRLRITGVLVMGLCRAGSVAMGVVAATPSGIMNETAQGVMTWWAIYIGSISWLASRETGDRPYGWSRWIPALVMISGAGFMMYLTDQTDDLLLTRSLYCFIVAALIIVLAGVRLGGPSDAGRRYPPAVGRLISALIPMQAGMLFLFAKEPWVSLAALLILLCWPINRLLAKFFSPS